MPPKTRAKSTLGPIKWTENSNMLIWKLLDNLAEKANHPALYGVQKGDKTKGDTKTKIHKAIALSMFPDLYEGNEDTLAGRIKNKIDNLYDRYKKEVKRLIQTGGGLGGNDDAPEDSLGDSQPAGEEHLDCYIGAEGPDATTTSKARNIWEKINEDFEFFATMHRYLATRPNAIPPVVTTGVGPEGRHVIHYQPLDAAAPEAPAGSVVIPDPVSAAPAVPPAAPPAVLPAAPPAAPPATAAASVSPSAQAAAVNKENVAPSGGRRGPRESSFTVTAESVEKAKASIQRVQKRGFEERLADATEASLRAAEQRAVTAQALEQKRFILEQVTQLNKQRDQVLDLWRSKLYNSRETKRRLAELDEQQKELERPLKLPRVRSPSPALRPSSPGAGSTYFSSSPLRPEHPRDLPSFD